MENVKEEIETIVNEAIEKNAWNKLSSKEYEEYYTVTEIGKKIIINNKPLQAKKVNEILEEMDFIKRQDKRIIMTNKGKAYGRYVICIKYSGQKSIITDKGYIRYKLDIIDVIKKHLENKESEEK